MKKIIFKTLSAVLAVVMMIGMLPFVYRLDRSLSASEDIPTSDSEQFGFVQGENDLVILMTTSSANNKLANYSTKIGAMFKGSKINAEGVWNEAAGKIFDRLIFVFTQNISISAGTAKQVELNGWGKSENVVWTSKCYISKPEYVCQLELSDNTTLSLSKPEASVGPINHYDSNTAADIAINVYHRANTTDKLQTGRILLGTNFHFDYLTVNTDSGTTNGSGYYPVIDANGYNLKIGKNVKFKYNSGVGARKYLIVNSNFNQTKYPEQTIEIIGGEYSGILAYPAELDCNKTLSGTLNVKLDGVKINRSAGFDNSFVRACVLANAGMTETAVINYEINNVNYSGFENPFCIFAGRKYTGSDSYIAADNAGAGPVAAGTINLIINQTDLTCGIAARLSNSDSSYILRHDVLEQGSGLDINVVFGEGTTIGSGKTVKLDAFESEYTTTTVFVNDKIDRSVITMYDYIEDLAVLDCSSHTFTATAGMDIAQYKVALTCTTCGLTREFDADRNGYPAVYVDALTGNDNYLGDSIATAVQSMTRASLVLAEWGVGGTIVVVDAHNNYQYMAEGNDTERIYSAGGPITITSNTSDFVVGEKIDFRETANACWVPLTNVRTTEDIILEDLILVPRNSGTRVLYLSGRDLIVKESCEFRAPVTAIDGKDVNLYARGTRMQYLETAPTALSLALISGYNPSAAKAEDVGTQNIVLESGVYKLLGFGNRSSSLDKKEETALTGNVNVYVGKGVVLNTIDAAPDVSALNPTFVFENGVDYEIATELPTTADVNIKAKADVVNVLADHVVIANNENFAFVQNSVKWENNQASVRVENVVSADWMEANVAELGFFIKEYDHVPFATYFVHEEFDEYVDYENDGVGKSLVYEKEGKGTNNYFWDGDSDKVTFRGVLKFDIEQGGYILNAYKTFIAVPYALLTNGEFVNGTPTVFTLKDVCEAIVANQNASTEDKQKAQAIIDSLPELLYPSIVDGDVFGGESELAAPDLSLLPVTPDIDDSEKTNTFDENNIVLSFGAISDTHAYSTDHGNNVKYPNALQTLNEISGGKLDLIAIAGDMVNINNTSQSQDKIDARAKAEMAMFSMLTKQNTEWMIDPTNVIATTGNHDQRSEYAKQPALYSTYLGPEYYEKDFETNLSAGYRHAVYNGYHFIILDADVIDPYHYGEFKPSVLNWLDKRLEVITEQSPDKYVFIITHAGVNETSYGTEDAYQPGSNRWTSETLGAVVEKYPQVIIFTGHTHTPIFDERSIAQSGFTAVNCGAVANTSLELEVYFNHVNDEEPVLGNEYISTGHYVQVDASGNVRITRILFPNYDTSSDGNQEYQTIKTPWELEYPKADGSHLEKYQLDTRREANEAPVLTGELSAVASGNANDVILTVPAGEDDDFVHHFDIVVTDADTDAVIAEYKMVTDFICRANPEDMLDEYSFRVPCAQANCMITVTAVDSWSESSDSLTTIIDLTAAE